VLLTFFLISVVAAGLCCSEDLNAWEVKREEHVKQLAEKHGMKVAEVRK
jgi:hypothetical protein